jgi:glycosyltransferase involved in cell wall biosynthesis
MTHVLAEFPQEEGMNDSVLVEPIPDGAERPRVAGKFLFAGDEKLWIKGVTYGTFRPQEDGNEFPEREVVQRDFAMMAERGINSVRTYIPPPRWLLDLAQQAGLRVMVGLAWEQHVAFLNDKAMKKTIEGRIRDGITTCVGHPSVLCYTIGNEIPPSIVRWHGRKNIERFLKKLYGIAKATDPGGLVTYVNFPTTEYLQLPFLDFQCFNVYLENREVLANYLARLQNLVDEKPLVMAEIGLDSQRNGEDVQAESLDWQMRTAFAEGCAGTFIFAWTDEWYRGGHDIEDWDFGLTTRDREPKPALEAVTRTYAELPFPPQDDWPKVSVVVCSYNGANTIRDTMEGLKHLAYLNFEVIVVNDGSTDATPAIAGEYDVKLISTENRGLSAARNTGWQEASGEIIAYIDDDAYPDPHWLHYIVHTYQTTDFVGVGGPNIAPPGDGSIAECVYNSPGGPVHVLLSDREAEHIPGCNMTFKRSALQTVGGFDPRYRAAGDDVDMCWRIQEQVGKIGFHAAAMDWHHRRNSLKMYWNQQKGYGKAEALLEEKWPRKYNAMGHHSWSGRLYGRGLTESLKFSGARVYGGPWGSALFQSLYQPATGLFNSLPLMPEWYFVIGMLAVLSLLGLSWSPLVWFTPVLMLAVAAPVAQAIVSAAKAEFPTPVPNMAERLKLRSITAVLHLAQPMARLIGRLKHGLSPWRRRGVSSSSAMEKMFGSKTLWSETWRSSEEWLSSLTGFLAEEGVPVIVGSNFDAWDLQLVGGAFGRGTVNVAVEEHGAGKQLTRFRVKPIASRLGLTLMLSTMSLALLAAIDKAWLVSLILVIASAVSAWRLRLECGFASTAFTRAIEKVQCEKIDA